MRVLMVLPSLTEAKSPFFRPIKYSLFPPLGLASLASHLPAEWDIEVIDEHTMPEIDLTEAPTPCPDLAVIQTYITNAKRSYAIADHFRNLGIRVAIGGLHATSLPSEAANHADHLFLGPGDATFPCFIKDLLHGSPAGVYDSRQHDRTLISLPPIRRDLIRRELYLVPNSIVVTRGCPHHCDFCYKDAFFQGGRGFYTQPVDDALHEIERLPGRHLYFLDDHLLGHQRFARSLFDGMRGMNRVFQGASTVDAVLRGDLIERAVDAGLRSLFIGFETLSERGLSGSNKGHNIGRDYAAAIRRLDQLGVMVNASFVFGLDGDDASVFDRTVDWAKNMGITTATFHIATPYPGTRFFDDLAKSGRIKTRDWDIYDTRHAVFKHPTLTGQQLEDGYWKSYREFYSINSIIEGSRNHCSLRQGLKHFGYALLWKRLEPFWNLLIRTKQLRAAREGLEKGLDIKHRRPQHSLRPSDVVELKNDHTHTSVPLTVSAESD